MHKLVCPECGGENVLLLTKIDVENDPDCRCQDCFYAGDYKEFAEVENNDE